MGDITLLLERARQGDRGAQAAVEEAEAHADAMRPRDRHALIIGLYNALRSLRRPGLLPVAQRLRAVARELPRPGGRPGALQWHAEVVLADALVAEGDVAQGLALFATALDGLAGALGPEHRQVGIAANWMGVACRTAGDAQAALAAFERSERVLSLHFPPGEFSSLVASMNVASAWLQLRRPEAARERLQAAWAALSESLGPDHVEARRAADALTLACLRLGEFEAAAQPAQARAAAGLGGALETARWQIRQAWPLAAAAVDAASARAALAAGLAALAQAEAAGEGLPADRATERLWAGQAALALGDPAAAEPLLAAALALFEQRHVPHSPDLAECRQALAAARA